MCSWTRTRDEKMEVKSKKPHKRRNLDDIIPELLGIPVHLELTVPKGFADKLKKFVKDHGLHPKFDVRKVVEFGLAEESDEELERLEGERRKQSSGIHGNYATTKFRAYENLMDNEVLTLKLQFLVSKNESLRRLLAETGLVDLAVTKWTKAKIEEFQCKYLFGKKGPSQV
jgi:hypothetical protein